MVQKHQAVSFHSAGYMFIVFDQFRTELGSRIENSITDWNNNQLLKGEALFC